MVRSGSIYNADENCNDSVEWLDQTIFTMTVLNIESDTVTPVVKVLYWVKCLLEKSCGVGLEK